MNNIPPNVLLSHLTSLQNASASRTHRQGAQVQVEQPSAKPTQMAQHQQPSPHPPHAPHGLANLQQLSAAYQLLGYGPAPPGQPQPGASQAVVLPPEFTRLMPVAPGAPAVNPGIPQVSHQLPNHVSGAAVPSPFMAPAAAVYEQPVFQTTADAQLRNPATNQLMDRKIQKRAANRKSAQLSRKRKKAFVDELKAENATLKRNKDILDCIPDLVFAFDALSGKIVFASNSVYQCLQVPTARLLDLSIFNLVTESSGKKLKELLDKVVNTRPAQEQRLDLPGRIELCFLTKYMTRVWGELDGVVQFNEDLIECVCSFRPSARNQVLMAGYPNGSNSPPGAPAPRGGGGGAPTLGPGAAAAAAHHSHSQARAAHRAAARGAAGGAGAPDSSGSSVGGLTSAPEETSSAFSGSQEGDNDSNQDADMGSNEDAASHEGEGSPREDDGDGASSDGHHPGPGRLGRHPGLGPGGAPGHGDSSAHAHSATGAAHTHPLLKGAGGGSGREGAAAVRPAAAVPPAAHSSSSAAAAAQRSTKANILSHQRRLEEAAAAAATATAAARAAPTPEEEEEEEEPAAEESEGTTEAEARPRGRRASEDEEDDEEDEADEYDRESSPSEEGNGGAQ
mmetsp:Transcript_7866/g.12418  ORF Transcript_7866/g.12418 Transcript_7866/m.12418 type:complete len:621 (-) Transcript_7866:381-2243(-)